MRHYRNEPGYWHAINLDNGVITPSGAYYGIQEANKKIATFGPLLSSPASHDPLHSPQLTWIDAITLPVGLVSIPDIPDKCPETNLSDLCLYGLTVVPSANGYYEGFVQAGLYKDMASGLPSFMLVNRRANYFNNSTYISPKYIPPSELDLHFVPAEAQTVRFFFNQDYQDIVGDYCGLYEPGYEFYPGSGTTIDVPIDAGDGRLLQLVGTLPEVVNTDATLKTSVVLSGQIQLSSGVNVDILSNAKVIIFPDTHFVLDSFSSLCLRGDVSIGDNVRFTVAEGASLIILEAECSFEGDFTIEGSGNYVVADSTSCTYQANASILITDGINAELSGTHILQGSVVIAVEDGSSLLFADSSITRYPGACVKVSASSLSFENCRYELVNNGIGNGVEVTDLSTLSMENSVFNQVPILVSNSDLSSINCDYIIRRGHSSLPSYGIKISDPLVEHTLRVVNSEDGHGFWGSTPLSSANPSFGIDLNIANSPLIISNVSFDSLSVGILKSDAATCSDSLLNCSFTHCKTGIKQISLNTNGVIENCSFTENTTGISLMGSLPTIISCSFIACETGVYFEDAYYAPRESGIYNSVFQMCDTAVESRSANPRVENCDFYLNDVGLKCHNDSNANLSYNAGNSFRNRVKNIQFIGDNYYHSYIQLLSGHNDFWNFGTPDQGIGAYDFHFDDFYDSATGSAIDATKNWFEADSLIINIEDNPIYQDYVIVEAFDEFPNSSEPDPDGGNRYLIALNQEASGQFEQAIAQYKTILNDGLESEKHYYNGCVDGLFRVQCLEEMQAELLAGFLDQKIVQYTAIDSAFCKLLSDYQIRAEVASGDFQSAVNIVQARIDNPVSAVDSLRAVLDLEIILQLESMSGTKKPLSLKYTQYKYPNVQVFHTKHDDHLKQLYALMGHGSEQDQIPIPNKALISSNYPNPFNPSTTIAFSIPEDGLVKLGIYNVKGQKVKDLCDSEMLRGHHKIAWDGRDKHQRDVSSGIYFVRLQASGAISTRKIMLMK